MPRVCFVRRLVAFAGACALLVTAEAAQDPKPQFRTGVDLTRVEVTVLDKRTREPITGLTVGDFVVKVSGDIQRVATLAEVKVPGPGEAPVPAFNEAAHDVTGNEGPRPRLFLILMNDAAGELDPFDRQTGKQIAHRIIDGLGPEDKAAVVFLRDNRHAQDFTSDRTLLRRAVERFNPMQTVGIVWPRVLERAQKALAEIPAHRRALAFISPVPQGSPVKNSFGVDEEAETHQRALSGISTSSRVSHVPLYVFGTHGLHAPTAQDMNPSSNAGSRVRGHHYEQFVEFARTVANESGGRAVVGNNAPAGVVPAILQELSSYYALGYESTHPHDGRMRWLDIQVKRPDVIVMPSRVLVATAKQTGDSADAVLNARRDSGLLEALGAALPAGDVPLRLSNVPLRVKDAREQAVALTLGLPPVHAGATEAFSVRLLLFDGEGRRQLRDETREITVAGSPETARGAEVAIRLDLRPGRYQLRIAADRKSTQTAGSVHATLVVPDFAEEPLSLSGVAIGRAAAPSAARREAIGNLLPFLPTTVRDFTTADKVGALLTVHQPPRRAAHPVTIETEIIDAAGAVVHTATRTAAPEAFATGSVEHRFELPLAALGSGSYLLRFVATAGKARVQRDVRFTVLQ